MNNWLLLFPLFSASIGWIMNLMMVKVLFHPRRPLVIFGHSIQGVLPKRQPEMARQIGKLVNEEFISIESVVQSISSAENLEKITPLIETHVDRFLKEKLAAEMPMISMFIGDKTIGKFKAVFMQEITTLFPALMNQYATNMKEQWSIDQLVAEKLAAFPNEKLEKMLLEGMENEIRFFKMAGACLGFVLGLALIGLTMLTR
jgi:uncharacterized membrane protein YheB (UPF0754 family)